MHARQFFVLVWALLVLSGASAQTTTKKSTTTGWALKGDYVDACSCPQVCSCEFGVPMEGRQGVGASKIKEGHYGDTSLNGATVALYIKPGV